MGTDTYGVGKGKMPKVYIQYMVELDIGQKRSFNSFEEFRHSCWNE